MPTPRPLAEILFELEELEGSPANLDDPEADYEARFERKDELQREALALGPAAVPAALEALVAARDLPPPTADGQRSFLAPIAAGHDDDGARQALGAALRTLRPPEVELLLASLPPADASRDAIAGWFVRQSEFARATGGGSAPTRLLLLEAYLARTSAPAADDPVVTAAAADPDEAVRARARR